MGIVVAKLFNNQVNLPEMRILMLGLDKAGKTTILYKLKTGETVNTIPTDGFNLETFIFKKIQFLLWDVGGQDHIKPIWRHYFFNGIEGLIFVVDSTDKERIEIAKEVLQRVLSEDQIKGIPLLVLANKEEQSEMSVAEISEKLDLVSIKEREWNIQGTCALTGKGLNTGFDWLSKQKF